MLMAMRSKQSASNSVSKVLFRTKMIGRLVSRVRANVTLSQKYPLPFSSIDSHSFPSDQIITEGWLKSRSMNSLKCSL